MRIRALGSLSVRSDTERELPTGGVRTRAVWAALLLNANQAVAVDSLVNVVWGEDPPASYKANLHTYLSGIRRVLGEATPAGADRLVHCGAGYRLDVRTDELDLFEFQRLVQSGRQQLQDGQPEAAALALRTAVDLAHGEPLANVVAHGLEPQLARLREDWLAAVEDCAEAELALGRHALVASELGSLVLAHPLRERLRSQLMLALAGSDRQAEALDVYQAGRRLLIEELGIEPGSRLRAAHAAVLRGDGGDRDSAPGALAGAMTSEHVGQDPGLSAVDTPAVDTPAVDTPAVDTPAVDTPAVDTPAVGALAVGAPGLPVPAIASGPTVLVPRQLPSETSRFTGRSAEISALHSLRADPHGTGDSAVPIVTITGTAGVGKTALAVHWAHQIAESYPDGQLYLNLHGYSAAPPVRPIDALCHFLRALGVPPDQIPVDVAEAAARFRSMVADRRLLLLLDNVASAQQIRALLPGSRSCLVIVTSRERLGGLVAGEGAHPLPLTTLTPAEGLDLLSQVLGAARVSRESAAATELVRLCAGLPLALRVAAANLAGRPQRRIAGYLAALAGDDGLAALEIDGDAHTAVRTAFELSYHRLPESARRLFCLMGAAPVADLTAAATAALTGTTLPQASKALDVLAGVHLVEEVEEGRFAAHDLLRTFAQEQVRKEGREEAAHQAIGQLLRWYLASSRAAAHTLSPSVLQHPVDPQPAGPGLQFEDHPGALTWLDAERSNLVTAIGFAADHGWATYAWQLADVLRGYFRLSGHLVDWLQVAEAGQRAADRVDDPRAGAATHLNAADAHRAMGQYADAVRRYSAALESARAAGLRESEATIVGNLGTVHWYQGRLEQAAEHFGQALELHRAVRRHVGMANTLDALACVYLEWGRLDRAVESGQQALWLHRELGSVDQEANDLDHLGQAYRACGDHRAAMEHSTRALELYRELGDRSGEVNALTNLAALHRDAGRLREAAAHATDALRIATEIPDLRGTAAARNALSSVQRRLGQGQEAVAGYQEVLVLARRASVRYLEAEALLGLAGARSQQPGRAIVDALEALAIATDVGYRVLEGQALTQLAELRLAEELADRALPLAQAALDNHRQTGHRPGLAHTLVILGRLADRVDSVTATRQWREALAILTEIDSPEVEPVRRLLARGRADPPAVHESAALAATTSAAGRPHDSHMARPPNDVRSM